MTITFKYDPLGRRIQKVFTTGTTTTTNYLYDGDNDIEELNASGTLLARYTQTQSIDEPLAESRSSTTSFYEADGLGSVTSLTNGSGTIANSYTYDSFGKLAASSGSVVNPFQYSAREFDSETGMYYYRTRYYDVSVGRFVSEDPIRFYGGENFYRYVGNNPINLRDPNGTGPDTLVLSLPVVLGGGLCFGSGVCETAVTVGVIVGGGVLVGDGLYNAYNYFSKRRKQSDPIPRPADVYPGQCDTGKGKCKPCPPPTPYWEQAGNAHGSTTGVHFHWYRWNQYPYPDCRCVPDRVDGSAPPPGGAPWTP